MAADDRGSPDRRSMRLLWYDVCGENARGKVSTEEIVAGLVWMILCLYVAAFLQVIVHEGGHLVCGLLSGYKFSSFRVGKVILVKKRDGIKRGRYSLMGTGDSAFWHRRIW